MKLTERDVEILRFINEFGFCEITHLERKFRLKKSRCYQVVQRLIKANLLKHARIFHGRNGVFYVTKQGANFTDLPILKNIPKDNYDHQLTVLNLYLKLSERLLDATWLSERRIRREKSLYCVGREIKHLCDGILVFPDDKKVAIEVELTMKSKERLQDIILGYVLHKHIKEVWYFCSDETIERVSKAAGKWPHIQISSLAGL